MSSSVLSKVLRSEHHLCVTHDVCSWRSKESICRGTARRALTFAAGGMAVTVALDLHHRKFKLGFAQIDDLSIQPVTRIAHFLSLRFPLF